ncbi:putative TetR family transcriptional regulator [Microlunatus phosphovorus NM-1]|uniref:Putative TetR family transcriptional regulator n=1 Tax=Microlunatus phosphovorus (strain ATCC 700054 / DSM 10555 / JCM 9379 / NBRC 101784 / NCIMB 13414 / VKM Ac-1990 / NM-1) TaxID=1032480 RepID=F5XSF2_MICPN|nr:TetR family transcriptional regulator C-terminal domain-containing protein [Microlunatus phosphovorus]BAK34833.1 putative TetR family transcriptional regulator [Microlunatus phosphovorus NM-1]
MGRDGAQTSRRVLDAVGRIVAARGLEGIRIREIAAEAELSPGSVLYHFPDHSQLLYAVHVDTVRRYVEGRAAAAAVTDATTDAAQRLLAVMRAGVPPWANEHVIRLLYGLHDLARRSQEHADLLTELWRDEQALYVEIIRAGMADGIFAVDGTPEEVAAGLLALEDGLVLHRISNNSEISSDRAVAVFAGIAAEQLSCPRLAEYAAG